MMNYLVSNAHARAFITLFTAESGGNVKVIAPSIFLDHLQSLCQDVLSSAQITGGAYADADFTAIFTLTSG